MSKTLHFTFTPVQAFVSQARRTRDLWAGSYLLAWLSGQAMCAILENKGEITVPNIDGDNLIAAIQGHQHDKDLAKSLGTLPNRFTANLPENCDPKDYAEAIQNQWIRLAEAIRQKIDPAGKIDKGFWDRQIKNLWEVTWVVGEESHLLDSRKNLRLPKQNEECGEKCTVCGERQELSECQKKPPFKPDRNHSKLWWAEFKDEAKSKKIGATDLDLRENERLCAVCLTKRAFPLVAGDTLGWDVEKYYPSTAYLSAIDWLKEVLDKAALEPTSTIRADIKHFVETANSLKLYNSEYNTEIRDLIAKSHGVEDFRKLIQLDGDVFYQSSIEADQLEKRGSNEKLSKADKAKLSEALRNVQKAVGSSATPFYTLLLMDGDGMGKLLGKANPQERKEISVALAKFTHKVPDIVYKNNGKLIYAGGDDVFALLPVSSAIRCADECRKAYEIAFLNLSNTISQKRQEEIKQAATISAAVQFAHQNIALGVVVRDAHKLLDEVAKERTGRNALACRVWKPGGIVLTWSQPWTVGGINFVDLLETVKNAFHPDKESNRFSSKFFYKLRDLFDLVENGQGFPETDAEELLVAEYLANREINKKDEAQKQQIANGRIKDLLALCQEQTRDPQTGDYKKGRYNPDAALLVRFLVQKEV